MEEWKIGEIRQIDNEWYQCLESNSCRCGCCNYDELGDCDNIACASGERKDDKEVYFKKLEKVGEPFACRNMSLGCYGIIVQRYKVFTEPILTDNSIKWCDSTNETILIALINKQVMEENREYSEEEFKNNSRFQYHKNIEQVINMKKMKEFDINLAKQGKPICTRDGRKARIICFDAKGKQPIIALLEGEKTDEEIIQTYSMNGRYYEFRKEDHRDLMILPEKKTGWININKDGGIFKSREEAERNCSDNYVTLEVEWEE